MKRKKIPFYPNQIKKVNWLRECMLCVSLSCRLYAEIFVQKLPASLILIPSQEPQPSNKD